MLSILKFCLQNGVTISHKIKKELKKFNRCDIFVNGLIEVVFCEFKMNFIRNSLSSGSFRRRQITVGESRDHTFARSNQTDSDACFETYRHHCAQLEETITNYNVKFIIIFSWNSVFYCFFFNWNTVRNSFQRWLWAHHLQSSRALSELGGERCWKKQSRFRTLSLSGSFP